MQAYVTQLYDTLIAEIAKYNSESDTHLIQRAFLYAKEAHKDTLRKSKEPYIIHPLHTALHLAKIEADDVSIVSGLLHDVLDNKNYKIKNIIDEFWEEVGNIVSGVVKLGDLYYTLDMNKREVENLKKNLILAGNDVRIFLVKLADRYHNLQTLECLPKQKRYRIAKETEEIYLPIVNFLSIGEYLSSLHDLCFMYTHEEEYKNLQKIFWKRYEFYKQKIIDVHKRIQKEFEKAHIGVINIEWRVKSLYSIYKKIKVRNIDLEDIYDVLALRIITKNRKDAYTVLWILHKLYKVKSDRFKDYISDPKLNGYQSIHTTVYDVDGEYVEFQIETQEMKKLNKLWMAAHFLYKWFGLDYKDFPEWMKWVLENQKKDLKWGEFIKKMANEVVVTEITCFDEKWNFYLLPKGSTLIDFAFVSWYEKWKFFTWALVNNTPTQNPFLQIYNNDMIIIETGKKVFIDYKIENFFLLKTNEAKNHIKQIFEKYSKQKLTLLWQFMIDNTLEIYSYRHFQSYSQKIKHQVCKSFWVKNEEQLYLFIAIGSIDTQAVLKKIMSLFDKKVFDKKVTLRLNLKMKDFNTIACVTKIFYNLHLSLFALEYIQWRNMILVSFEVDDNSTLQEVLWEIKRAPNILSVTRVFPFRLTLYYIIYFASVSVMTAIIFFMNYFNFDVTAQSLLLQSILFSTSILMAAIVFFIKYVVKTILPDILRYKRFWLSLFLLNTYVFFIIFWEALLVGFSVFFILYFFLSFLIYIIISYEYFSYRKYKN